MSETVTKTTEAIAHANKVMANAQRVIERLMAENDRLRKIIRVDHELKAAQGGAPCSWRDMPGRAMKDWCHLCGAANTDAHHIVPRSIKRCDDPENLLALCRACHRQVHSKAIDLLPSLTTEQQAKAVELTGSIESARILLAPSAYRVTA